MHTLRTTRKANSRNSRLDLRNGSLVFASSCQAARIDATILSKRTKSQLVCAERRAAVSATIRLVSRLELWAIFDWRLHWRACFANRWRCSSSSRSLPRRPWRRIKFKMRWIGRRHLCSLGHRSSPMCAGRGALAKSMRHKVDHDICSIVSTL